MYVSRNMVYVVFIIDKIEVFEGNDKTKLIDGITDLRDESSMAGSITK